MATYLDDERSLRGSAFPQYQRAGVPTVSPSRVTAPTQSQVRAVDNAIDAPPSSLRNFFQLPNFPAAAQATNDAVTPATPVAPVIPRTAPLVAASTPTNPVAQVRAVDNNVENAAAIANPQSALPASYPAAGSLTQLPGATDTMGQLQRDIAHQQGLQKLRNPNDPAPGVTVIGDNADARQKFFDEANLRNAAARGSWSPRRGFQGDTAAVEAAALPIRNRQRLAELSLTNEGRMGEARLRDATDRRGQDVQAAVASLRDQTDRRGQDITARGQDITARTAATNARLDQMNKDRQFQLDVQKFGQDTAAKNFDQRQKAQEGVTSQITAMLPPGADGKPDAANAARYTAGLNTLVSDRINALQAQLQRTPGRKDVADELDALQSRGLAAMDQAAIRKYVVGQQTADLAAQTGTGRFVPWGTDAANSTAPITSLREVKGLFGSDFVSDRGDVIPGRYLRQDGKQNQDLRNLIRQ